MSLTPGFSCALDLFRKLQRDAELLNHEVTSDRFLNFVITGYSIIDWVKHDQSLPAQAHADSEISALYREPWLKVCGDLATASKHCRLTHRTPVADGASTQSGFGVGRFGVGGFGVGEEYIEVTVNTGESFTALEFVTGVLHAWLRYFRRHGMNVDVLSAE